MGGDPRGDRLFPLRDQAERKRTWERVKFYREHDEKMRIKRQHDLIDALLMDCEADRDRA